MRTPYFIPGARRGNELDDLATLEQLVADLASYARGDGPSEKDLARAPLMRDWVTVRDHAAFRFRGEVSGHPRIGPGPGVTSRLCAVDTEQRWVRTYSRLWRLGPRHEF